MFERIKAHLPLLATALIAGIVVAVGPSIAQAAYDAVNSDKVDGRHAVGSAATVTQRSGKLVATSPRSGLLPNNIIKKAPNADRLDGLDSKALYTRAQINAMPFHRLLGFGQVTSLPAWTEGSFFPGATVSKSGTGSYQVTIPGYGPGCVRAFPVAVLSAFGGTREVTVSTSVMTCATGDLSVYVNTANSAGTLVDGSFSFMLFSGDAQSSPAARQRAGAEVCELTESGVHCR